MSYSASNVSYQAALGLGPTYCNTSNGMSITRSLSPSLASNRSCDAGIEDDACSMGSCHTGTWDCEVLVPRIVNVDAPPKPPHWPKDEQLSGGKSSNNFSALLTDIVEGSLALADHVSITSFGPSSDHITSVSPQLFKWDSLSVGITDSHALRLANDASTLWTGSGIQPVSPQSKDHSCHAGSWSMPRRGSFATSNVPRSPSPRAHLQQEWLRPNRSYLNQVPQVRA